MKLSMKELIETNYSIGQVVRHKYLDFTGVIFDVDPEFNNTEEWYQSIPQQIRPRKDQPFYHVFAENDDVFYTAYVSQDFPHIVNRMKYYRIYDE